VPYRLVGHAEDRIDALLLDSAKRWGITAAARYHRLILAAAAIAGEDPGLAGSREVPRLPRVRTLHLRSVRGLVPAEHRVAEPRHLIVYRVAGTASSKSSAWFTTAWFSPERPGAPWMPPRVSVLTSLDAGCVTNWRATSKT